MNTGTKIALIALALGLIAAAAVKQRRRRPSLLLTFITESFKVKGVNMAVTLTTTQQVRGTVQPVDRHGKPAKVQSGSIEYSTSDPAVAVVVENPEDETQFTVKAVGEGVAELTVTADADLGEGVQQITAFAAIEVVPEAAVGFSALQFGAPEDQPTENTEGGEGGTTGTNV